MRATESRNLVARRDCMAHNWSRGTDGELPDCLSGEIKSRGKAEKKRKRNEKKKRGANEG